MDHLLSRVGFHPTLTTIKAYLLQGNSQWISRNSLAAYHALNVASNVIFYYFLFCSSLFSFTCFTCGMSHLFRSEYWDAWVAIKIFILTRGNLHGTIWFHGSRRIVAVMRLKITSESEGVVVLSRECPHPWSVDLYARTWNIVNGLLMDFLREC